MVKTETAAGLILLTSPARLTVQTQTPHKTDGAQSSVPCVYYPVESEGTRPYDVRKALYTGGSDLLLNPMLHQPYGVSCRTAEVVVDLQLSPNSLSSLSCAAASVNYPGQP